jgi:Tol biopolymer transport system component
MLGRTPARLLAAIALLLTGPALGVEVSSKDGGHVQNPVWSPDGQWLSFEVNNMSNVVELWLTKMNGSAPGTPTQLRIPGASTSFGAGGYFAASPVWATTPALMIVFEGSNPGGKRRLYYANPGSGAPNELITNAQIQGNISSAAISKSGKRFAFISDVTGSGDVYVWNLEKGDLGVMGGEATESSENFPSFNDAGDTIVFSRKNDGNQDLFTWNSGTTTPPLKGGNGDQTRPRWVGDKVVYFTSERGEGHWDIAVTGKSGERVVVAQDVRLPSRSAPAVTPDGSAVVYASSVPEKADRLLITRLDGSSTVEIPTGLVACGEPALTVAGGRTLVAFTALPSEGADWRRLHVIDITGKL